MKQTILTVLIFMIVGGSAYFWRHSALQKVNHPSSGAGSVTLNSPLSPLGDMSVFIKITTDTRDLVAANDLAGAKTRVADLEHEWDSAQSRLKSMNGAEWTKVDSAIDKVLRELSAVNPTVAGSKAALDALLVIIK